MAETVAPGTLYVVGTPIGNLGDLSRRALEIFRAVDCIAAEDTRVTLKLLRHFGLEKPLVSYREHNKRAAGEEILRRLRGGESFALVSDAGMPAISDPGTELVDLCRENGVRVESVPGPSALTAALSVSGVQAGRFCFEGFLSVSPSSRRERLEKLKSEDRVIIFYEAPHKLRATLRDLLRALGDREVAVCKELTKIHETVRKTTLRDAAAYYRDIEPKGEYVLIVSPAPTDTGSGEDKADTLRRGVELAEKYRAEGLSPAAAAKAAAGETGAARRDIYRALTERSGEGDSDDGKTGPNISCSDGQAGSNNSGDEQDR